MVASRVKSKSVQDVQLFKDTAPVLSFFYRTLSPLSDGEEQMRENKRRLTKLNAETGLYKFISEMRRGRE